jgi:glycosyltransferase involved in cell wall biosynthesis
MRILTLCYEYPPIGGGGGRVTKTVAEGLAARGHAVRVQTAALGFRSVREETGGVEIYRAASGRRRPEHCAVPEMGLYVATSLLPALTHCRRWKPEVIHAHFAVPTGMLAWMLHRATGIPYVLTAHLGDVPGGVPEQTDRMFRLIGPFARAIWRRAAAATAVSGFVQELAERAYQRPVERILNGIDLAGRPQLESLLIGEPCRLLFLGRLNPQKNAPLLIEGLARLPDSRWKLTVIGDGPDAPEVRRLVERHGLSERVTLAGWREAREVEAALRDSDVLCLPSSSEGMPVAAVEALKFGLALATSDIPGVRDVARAGVNAVTAPAGDAGAYAHALASLLEDPARLLALRRGSWQMAEDFALPRILDAYERVLSGTSGSAPAHWRG